MCELANNTKPVGNQLLEMATDDGGDFVLIARDGIEKSVHKNVVGVASPYFEALVSKGFSEGEKNAATLCVDSHILVHLLTFIYNRDKISVKDEERHSCLCGRQTVSPGSFV